MTPDYLPPAHEDNSPDVLVIYLCMLIYTLVNVIYCTSSADGADKGVNYGAEEIRTE
jgi:hypothetical protein